tara:strand:- start:3634 stop:4326 length:693 start_codon:yes stop_codon:yes gene_type:complete
MTRETVQKPKGPPAAVLGPPSYGFLVSEDTFEKVTKRVDYAERVADMALRGKRIVGFNDAPYKSMFWQHPYNDADAYAHVGYWTAIAAMGTGNQKLALAAKKYTNAADRWNTVFLRMKDGGVATIYRNAANTVYRQAGSDISKGIVKRVLGVFSQQGDPQATKSARERTVESDPIQQVTSAIKKTVTTPPQLNRTPKWVWALVGVGGILAVAVIVRPYFQAAKKVSRRGN